MKLATKMWDTTHIGNVLLFHGNPKGFFIVHVYRDTVYIRALYIRTLHIRSPSERAWFITTGRDLDYKDLV